MGINAAQSRAARAFIRITRQELADASGVGLRTINYFEDEHRIPRPETLILLQRALEDRGILFLEMFDSPGLIKKFSLNGDHSSSGRNSIAPSATEMFAYGICAQWDDIWTYLTNNRLLPDAYDGNKTSIHMADDTAYKDIYGGGIVFSVDMDLPKVIRSSLSMIKTSPEGIIHNMSLSAVYKTKNIIRYSTRTFRKSENDDDQQALVAIDGRYIRVSSASVIYNELIEHPEYYRKSQEKSALIASTYSQPML